MGKHVYFFGGGKADGNIKMKDILGGKGAGLAEMTNIGIPVPPGFTISTEVCVYYYRNNGYPEGLKEEVQEALKRVEELTGKKFGDKDNPLLVSVRSGARVSMPGMMDTILNLGLNDETVQGLMKQTDSPRFAYDSYRRFVQMYGNVVLGVEHDKFEEIINEFKEKKGVKQDIELDADDWKAIKDRYKELIKKETGHDFPENPEDQLWGAISAVFKSWNNQRAIEYRRINNIPDDWGTAVNVQTMVFGNMGEDSGTGVAFTRNPSTGENVFYGEYLMNAQGEDVVAGIRTPLPISKAQKQKEDEVSLEEAMPEVYKQLLDVRNILEKHFKDMQDLEFTIERGKLYLLQTRTGKRTARAAVKIAVDMVNEGLIDKEEAVIRITPEQVDQLLHPMIDPKAEYEVIAKGLPASPGAATGKVVFTAEEAVEAKKNGEKVILVRHETSPEDVAGMHSAEGILTARGGMTSHAAVVARGMGKPCVVGCEEIVLDYQAEEFRVKDRVIKKGDIITIDGTTGSVIPGDVPKIEASISGEFEKLMVWADEIRRLGVRANADTPHDAETARKFGAEGIGLARTEHMFFKEDRIPAMREMILADDLEGRKKALEKLLPMQRADFEGLFRAMDGFPVIIRLLDPPLHEFLPKDEDAQRKLAETMGVPFEKVKGRVEQLSELNPMLGLRGCRLGILYPEITEMQARAIFEAACNVAKEGIKVIPEVMVPLVGNVNEIKAQKEIITRVAEEVMNEKGMKIKYMVGTMIELPRAALTADEIAKEAEFFSYGTNDLTQTTFGFSRDDVGKFVPMYIEKGILPNDPFRTLDQNGVGQLLKMGLEKGKKTRPELEVGICGEHGGDPASVEFCHRIGMDYVSCSPFRVPIARLAAAHAVIKEKRGMY
ncbi:MAG TPA: pyruvate, phosphate dikinase [candidate division WOR-3 bacterium]|uniref:Pyruvate, phosphate dikinase n=1 Tax=candidate division WOR-3 bacterium TaxID=2052148 RepID=A0A7C0ZCH3_UNCW3|nr:pyruvate, phosphate dikinase [candidate division WOR-3 bacterium]